MGLLRRFIRNDLADLHRNGVRVRVIGEREDLEPDIRQSARGGRRADRGNDKLILVVAFNYGARAGDRARRAAHGGGGGGRRSRGQRRSTADTLASYLDAPDCPIPTSSSAPAASSGCPISCCGRRPIANSCLCRFTGRTSIAAALESAIAEYSRRERRFGGLVAQYRIVTVAEAEPTRPFDCAGAPARNLALRVASALVLAPLAIAVAYVGGWPFVVFWGARCGRGALGMDRCWSRPDDRRTTLATGAASLALAVALAGADRRLAAVIVVGDGHACRGGAWRRPRGGYGSRGGIALCRRHRARAGRAPDGCRVRVPRRYLPVMRSSGRPTSWVILSGARSAVPS